jgi:hypothetical protein
LVAWAGKWVSPIIRFYCPIRKQVCELLRGLAAARDAIARLLDVALIEIRDHAKPGNHSAQNNECCIAKACACHGLTLRASPEHHAKRNIGIRVKTFSELNSMVDPLPLDSALILYTQPSAEFRVAPVNNYPLTTTRTAMTRAPRSVHQ